MAPVLTPPPATRLYHATSASNRARIQVDGLTGAATYFATLPVARYYAATVEDEGEAAVLLSVALGELHAAVLEPDVPGIEEPICSVIGLSEDAVHDAWASGAQTWMDSWALIGSLRERQAIPAVLLWDDSAAR